MKCGIVFLPWTPHSVDLDLVSKLFMAGFLDLDLVSRFFIGYEDNSYQVCGYDIWGTSSGVDNEVLALCWFWEIGGLAQACELLETAPAGRSWILPTSCSSRYALRASKCYTW